MRRFFCETLTQKPSLSKESTHHLQKVLRIEIGEKVLLFNSDHMVEATLLNYDSKQAQFELSSELQPVASKQNTLQLICALPKQQRLSTLIEKIAEIGCDHFTPLYTSRSAVKLHPDKIEDRLQRWGRIALSATTQSKQCKSTLFSAPLSILKIQEDTSCISLIFTTEGDSRSIDDIVRDEIQPKDTRENIRILIGPEGGFSTDEITHCIEAGFIPAHLNLPVLRIETAAIIATAILKALPPTESTQPVR